MTLTILVSVLVTGGLVSLTVLVSVTVLGGLVMVTVLVMVSVFGGGLGHFFSSASPGMATAAMRRGVKRRARS